MVLRLVLLLALAAVLSPALALGAAADGPSTGSKAYAAPDSALPPAPATAGDAKAPAGKPRVRPRSITPT